MYLKALEIHGFKSFPDKTLLSFEHDITAIVGPNGSGKSNISDAIRWVMGEQSTKALRGGKMEDVIFGGTERRPQLGYAEVSLILENADRRFDVDSNELMITRRYYRSGDSEYYINKSLVRLKDVNELLMDTGLGREGYSIIGQGRIDEVLSVKSADRREIFEEAAGISKFRHRKEEAERKLLRTEENLTRINDKINELEYQVEPLREQAEVAKKYLNLRDELRIVEVSVWLETLDRLGDSSKQLFAEYEGMKNKLEKEHALLEELYAQTENQSERMRRMDVDAEGLRAEITALEASAAECESEIAVHTANIKNNEENIRRAEEDILREGGRAEGISEQIAERERRVTAISVEAERLDNEITLLLLQSRELAETHDGIADKIANLRERQLDAQRDEHAVRSELSALAASAQGLMDRDESSASELLQITARLAEAREQAEAAGKEYAEAEEGRQSLENTVEGYGLRQAARKKRHDDASEKNRRLGLELDALKNRIAMLEDMEREYQGYSKAVRSVMQEQSRGTLKNIHGTIASLIRTEDRYAYAIETALGGAMQNIVVGSEQDGKAAINLLKRRDGGRATFMPLSMRGSEFRDRGVEQEVGYEGVASELISFDDKYRGIIEYLIGRTVIVSDIDAAIAISNKYSSRFAIVTLDGQIMNRGGSMTGGSAGRNTGILSRANELEKLREQRTLLEKDLEESARACSEHARELEKAASQLDIARAELRTFEDKLLKLGAEREQRRLLLSELEYRAGELKRESESLGERMEKNRAETEEKRARIAEFEKQAAELTGELDAVILSRSELSGKNDELGERLGNLRIDRATLDSERDEILRAVGELEELRRDMSQGREAGLKVIEEYREKNRGFRAVIEVGREKLEDINARIQEKRAELGALVDGKLQLEGERTRREKECQDKNTLILDMERETARLEQKKLAAEMEQKQIIDKLWDTYELGPTAAQAIRTELESLQKGTRRVAELKRSMASLGTPNLGAIDEYARVSERYEYLKSQHEDISKAKAELERIIRDITSEMTNIFAESFERIKKSFATTFVELFGGGYGELALEDESDILNCGIEIHVQPPGKAVRSLTLLSGGEKAFVAIALYFAILKVSPTPFCIMDEIEAALDETNVLRFATYLRNLSNDTQFLIITHRRGTMEESDVLYGVTMQEQGVSRILAMDLNEAERRISAS